MERREEEGGVCQRWVGLEADFERAYVEHYHRLDPWMPAVPRMAVGECQPSAAMLSHAELGRSAFHEELGRRYALCDLVGGVIEKGPERVVTMAVMGPGGARLFGHGEARLLEQALPHVRQALRVEEALGVGEQEKRALWSVVDEAPSAVFALDASARILRTNARATELLRTRASDALRVCCGRLTLVDAAAASCLQAALRGAAHGHGPIDLAPGTDRALRMRLVRPAPETLDAERGGAVILAIVTARPPEASRSLRQRFGLSPAEARVAEGIGRGRAPKEIAVEQDVSWNTVRTQLGHIFRKTGVSSQRELASLVTRLRHGAADE